MISVLAERLKRAIEMQTCFKDRVVVSEVVTNYLISFECLDFLDNIMQLL